MLYEKEKEKEKKNNASAPNLFPCSTNYWLAAFTLNNIGFTIVLGSIQRSFSLPGQASRPDVVYNI